MHAAVFTDHFSHYAIVVPIPNKATVTVAEMYFKHVCLVYAAPAKLLTDQGKEFDNVLMHTLCELTGTQKLRTSAKHPQSNGVVERFNRTLAVAISMYVDADHKSWDRYVQQVTYAYNTSIHKATGFTPFYLMFCRNPFSQFDRWILPPEVLPTDAGVYVENMRAQLGEAYANVELAVTKAKDNAKLMYDRKVNFLAYQVGDLVLLYSDAAKSGTAHKFNSYYSGPYVVRELLPNYIYKIQLENKPRSKVLSVHFNRLKSFFRTNDDDEIEPSQQMCPRSGLPSPQA